MRGQSLIEVLIAVALGVMLTVAATTVVAPILTTSRALQEIQTGASLGKELLDNVRSFAEANWHNLYDLNKGSSNTYYLTTSTSPFLAVSGAETVVVAGVPYERFFYVENVSRNLGFVTEGGGGSDDPSTQKVTVGYRWSTVTTKTISQFLARSFQQVTLQTDWSGGSGESASTATTTKRFDTSVSVSHTTTTGSLFIQGY